MIRSKNISHNPTYNKLCESISCVKSTNKNSFFQSRAPSAKSLNRHQGSKGDFLEERRQSYLNSCFNKRKTNLLKITKENRKIYERINSQKSRYTKKSLNKSYYSSSHNHLASRDCLSKNQYYSKQVQEEGPINEVINGQGLFSLASHENYETNSRRAIQFLKDPLVDLIMSDKNLMNFKGKVLKKKGKQNNKLKIKRNLFLIA